MPRSSRSSNACVTCRLDWTPSRWLLAALIMLPLLAAFSLLESNLPSRVAWLLAASVLGLGGWSWRREARRPGRNVVLRASGEEEAESTRSGVMRVEVDGVEAERWRLQWRGPLAFMQFRMEGKRQTLSWWPDTLPPAKRRQLRLVAGVASRTTREKMRPDV